MSASPVLAHLDPGVKNGATVLIQGAGAPGFAGGGPGDLLLDVEVRPHPLFVRVGDDLKAEFDVPVWDAALGVTIGFKGIDGSEVVVEVPPGTQPGTEFVVEGGGMPVGRWRGRLRVLVKIEIPAAAGTIADLFRRMRAQSRPPSDA